jgi:thioredoxin reductase (NADPH)
VVTNAEVASFEGDGRLERLVLRDRTTGETREIHPAGVFVFIGLSPNSELASDPIEQDAGGFIVTDPTLATGWPGVYAAGDVRSGSTKQAASAAGEGATAALSIRRFVEARASGIPHREAVTSGP